VGKNPDKITISSEGICGEDDFRCPHAREAGLPFGKSEAYQVEKSRYALDLEGFWPLMTVGSTQQLSILNL
jgi:hypothetical protein